MLPVKSLPVQAWHLVAGILLGILLLPITASLGVLGWFVFVFLDTVSERFSRRVDETLQGDDEEVHLA